MTTQRPVIDPRVGHLRRLAAELVLYGLRAEVTAANGKPILHVINPATPVLQERIHVDQADGTFRSWSDPIGDVARPDQAAGTIQRVLGLVTSPDNPGR